MHLYERLPRVGEVHQAEGAKRDIERGVLEIEGLRVQALERGVADATLGRLCPRPFDHFGRDVGAQHGAVRAHRGGGGKRDESGPAGHVQHPLPRPQIRHLEKARLGRLELPPPALLVILLGLVPTVPLHAAL